MYDIELGERADLLKGMADIQRGLNRLEKQAYRNLMKFSKDKHKILHLGWNNHIQQHRLRADQLWSIFAKKTLCPGGQIEQESKVCSYGEKGHVHTRIYKQECRQQGKGSGYFRLFGVYEMAFEYCVRFEVPQYKRH